MSHSTETIKAKVNRLLIEEFEIPSEEISPEGRLFEDYELDSLDAIDILLGLEKLFNIKLDDKQREKAKEIRTVGDIYRFVSEVVKA